MIGTIPSKGQCHKKSMTFHHIKGTVSQEGMTFHHIKGTVSQESMTFHHSRGCIIGLTGFYIFLILPQRAQIFQNGAFSK